METTQKNFLTSDVGNSKVSPQYKLFLPQFEFSKIYSCRVYKSLKVDTLFPIRFNTCVGSYLFVLLVKCQCYIIIMTNLLKTFGFLEKITLTINQRLGCLLLRP